MKLSIGIWLLLEAAFSLFYRNPNRRAINMVHLRNPAALLLAYDFRLCAVIYNGGTPSATAVRNSLNLCNLNLRIMVCVGGGMDP